MKYLKDIIKENGHKLTKYDKCIANHNYVSVFDYSQQHGGSFDGHKYYNDYVIDVTSRGI